MWSQALQECRFEICQPQPRQSRGTLPVASGKTSCGTNTACTGSFLAVTPRRPPHTMKLWTTHRVLMFRQWPVCCTADRRGDRFPHNREDKVQGQCGLCAELQMTEDHSANCHRQYLGFSTQFPLRNIFSLASENPGKAHNKHGSQCWWER